MVFIHNDFMLKNEAAKHLYHNFAKDLPIIDYHCHLSPEEIATDKQFKNITELWLAGDHYKWRALRASGIDEYYITGDASDKDKFLKWAEVVPQTLGNPLYHWTHLELKKYFGIEDLLGPETAEMIWEKANTLLSQSDYSTKNLIKRSNVILINTTDDPTDDLKYHKQLQTDGFDVTVLPTFRPDKGVEINKPTFLPFVELLEEVTNKTISDYDTFITALLERVAYFHDIGGRLADHGLGEVPYAEYTEEAVDVVFKKALANEEVSSFEEEQFKTAVINRLAQAYTARGWVMQIHFGAIRNNNTKMYDKLGPDSGFDSINDQANIAAKLNGLLNSCEVTGHLPKTILYNLNPIYNDIVGTTMQNFQTEAGIKGKIQFGSGWWFNDTRYGMERQLKSLSEAGLLMHFVGMLTDSRSFISYSRHEYFRRILCNLVGEWIEAGEVPNDDTLVQPLIENICYYNAKRYFNL
ncbi:glucuronate isomerase [Halolactibacillus halophilus]|uniref:Uronate isomerase n=1 Tax=Halolactibacillus halophilus TaxID=306540 RepID=A0A1I5M5W3_9BACI|nr:glucuronate isomerase [Halolactibacillus halophilus]GEM01016.1 uronate isomerase [Halolactibacillus halophilus]SFP04717.1 glucuronate isomerase [Halolactibacillus halophilus]